jgi:hypothetical protein
MADSTTPGADFTIEIDRRGEMLTIREGGRIATIICTFGGRPCLLPRTLDAWWLPAEKRGIALSPEERDALVARIAAHCRGRLGMADLVLEGE